MKTLLFLSRVAFLYNLCMLATFGMRYFRPLEAGAVQSVILISGVVLSVVFTGAVNLWVLLLLLRKRPVGAFRPQWLFAVNFLCFIFQVYLLLK